MTCPDRCTCNPNDFDDDLNFIYCERHKVKKTRRYMNACIRDDALRREWDEGIGPRQNKHRPRPPKKKIPHWVRRIAKKRQPGDVGPGDTFERIAKKYGADQILVVLKMLGVKDCGCGRRKETWNRRWAYHLPIWDQYNKAA